MPKTKTHPTMEEIYDRDIYEKEETVTKTTEEKVVENIVENTDRKEIEQFHEEEKDRLEPEYLTVYFEVDMVRPDSREFRMNSVEYSTPFNKEYGTTLMVAVKIPNIPLYVQNFSEQVEVTAEKIIHYPLIVLTPAGMFYVQQELEKPYLSLAKQSKKPVNETASDDGWDDDTSEKDWESPAILKLATKKSDDWDDNDDSSSTDKSDKGNEKVNVDEEDW